MHNAIRLLGLGRLLPLLLSIAPQVAGQEPAAGNGPDDYVNYGCRESGGAVAPRLVVEREDGTRESLPAVADALLIGYLPEGQFGGLRFLAVNLCGSNRELLRFGPVHGPVRKAEIVLRAIPPGRTNASPSLPAAPFEIGAYEVRETWDEDRVSWDTRPMAAESPSSTVRDRPDAAEVRLDVTGSARRLADPDAAARGWLIQVVHPMRWDAPSPAQGAAIERELLGLFPWAESVPEAIRRAPPRESSSSPACEAIPRRIKPRSSSRCCWPPPSPTPTSSPWSRGTSCPSASTSIQRPTRWKRTCRGPRTPSPSSAPRSKTRRPPRWS